MVGLASSDAGALFLLAQDGAQPSADEAVKDAKQSRRGMLEVAEPSLKHRVEVLDDPVETVASAPDRPGPHLVLERRQALLAHQPATRFEPVAQELEPLPRLLAVADQRLVRMAGQAVRCPPRRDWARRRPALVVRPAP